MLEIWVYVQENLWGKQHTTRNIQEILKNFFARHLSWAGAAHLPNQIASVGSNKRQAELR